MDNLPVMMPDDDRELEPLENPDLIWSKPAFPHKTKPLSYTPVTLFYALQLFADSVTPLSDIFDLYGVDRMSFYGLARQYREIQAAYQQARALKAEKYGEAALRSHVELPDDPRFYQTDKETGQQILTNAAAAFLKNRAAICERAAQYHENGTFNPVSRSENTNRNLSVSVQVTGKPSDFNLDGADPGALVDAIRGRKPR